MNLIALLHLLPKSQTQRALTEALINILYFTNLKQRNAHTVKEYTVPILNTYPFVTQQGFNLIKLEHPTDVY